MSKNVATPGRTLSNTTDIIIVMTSGIHHITAIASNAQKTIDFYTKNLGLRLVKKTVNQDDVSTYHLFFGDKQGHPGMDLTFFIFLPSTPGHRGNGLVTTIALAVPDTSLSFWQKRFIQQQIKHEAIVRYGKKGFIFYDEDDQQLEIVGIPRSEIEDDAHVWTTPGISHEHAIRSFHSATLSVTSKAAIEPILIEVFGYKHVGTDGHHYLYAIEDSKRGQYVEVSEEPSSAPGFNAAGTVHHIAFRAKDEKHQAEMRDKVITLGLYPTDVINRFYFKSVYFRTRAGILFEIATDGPGFTADEKEENLGKKLALPPFLENQRKGIEKQLIPISTD